MRLSKLLIQRLLRLACAASLALLAMCQVSLAHPHIWVNNRAVVVFDDQGRVSEIRHQWTFDAAFSAWATQGLDANGDGIASPEELQALADDNAVGLAEFEYYTFAGEGKGKLNFHAGPHPHMKFESGQNTFFMSVIPSEPFAIKHELEIEITDPEYYVAFSFADASATVLENAPPGCSVTSSAPKELDDASAKRLAEIGPEQVELPPDLKVLVRDQTNLAVVTCEAGSAHAASPEAVVQTVQKAKSATPFAAPPSEGALPMPTGGFLGWINAQQKAFYGALTNALGRLKSDGSAFWVLGALSFLYGVFHAAGPGHGKVVISSYVLASERAARRGIILSLAAAMVQSFVAIGVVLIGAAVLNMTSMALSGVAVSIEIWSYALILVLGLWLVLRKLGGFGHTHAGHDHDHGHVDDEDGHAHHVIMPNAVAGNWREAIGVVLAVGMRPCSGALIVLVFALSQGLLAAGMVAVVLMGLGTGLTVALLATLAVAIKSTAMRIGKGGAVAASFVWWVELGGALVLVAFGAVLLAASLL